MPQPTIDQIFATAKDFFDQPFDTKTEIHYKKSSILRGYEPTAEVRTDETKKADLNEAFNCGYEADLDPLRDNEPYQESKGTVHAMVKSFQLAKHQTDTAGDTPMQGPNAWPSMPGFKDSIGAYYGEVLTLARRMVRLFAKVLELPSDYFDACVSRPGAMLRLLKYPPQDPSQPDALGIGAHTDIEAFTILCQGSQPALQILNAEGQWIQAPPIPGTFVVNIGDMLSRWSNDVFISTVHRVHASCERYSIPFFFGPSYDTVLHPLPTCIGETGKAAYEPIVAGDYVWQRLARSRLSKEEVESKSFVQAPAAA